MSTKTKPVSIEERRNARRKRQKRKKIRRRITVTLLLLIGISIGLCFTPIFHVEEIRVSGAYRIPPEEIAAASGVAVGQNIFTFNVHDVAESIQLLPYVKGVTVRRQYPDVLSLEVQEETPVAGVTVGGMFVLLNESAKVLEAGGERWAYAVPLLIQGEIGNYTLGEKLPIDQEGQFPVLLKVAVSAAQHQLSDRIQAIYFTNRDIYLKLSDTLRVKFGAADKPDSRMTMLKAVLDSLPEGSSGLLDLTDGEKAYLTADVSP